MNHSRKIANTNKRKKPAKLRNFIELEKHTHAEAIRYKYLGFTYKTIANLLSKDSPEPVSERSLQLWFMSGGILAQAFDEYKREQNEAKFQSAKHILRSAVDEAARVKFQGLKSRNEKIQQDAATEILDRELGKPVQPVISNTPNIGFIEELKREMGIDEQSLYGVREVDEGNTPDGALPVSETNQPEDS